MKRKLMMCKFLVSLNNWKSFFNHNLYFRYLFGSDWLAKDKIEGILLETLTDSQVS